MTIKNMYNAVFGVKKDWTEDFKETSKVDWKFDFDRVAGSGPTIPPKNTVLGVITGEAKVGVALSVSTGTWTGTPAPTFTYQWRVGGVAKAGATTNSFTPVVGDIGKVVTCQITGSNGSGNPVSVVTAGTVAVVAAA